MKSFNSFSRPKSAQELLLIELKNDLKSMSINTREYTEALYRIECIEYKLHKARITGTTSDDVSPTTHVPTNTNNGAPMQAPVFSNDLVVRKQQYMEYLVAHEGYDAEEVAAMDMPTLRMHIDNALPIVTTVRTAHTNGGTTTKYIVRKAA